MNKNQKKEIEKIIGKMKCPQDFKCYQSGFEYLCKSRNVGIESYLECLEECSQDCVFSISYGNSYFCRCPLRVYLQKNLKV